jgi:hypothetical protein
MWQRFLFCVLLTTGEREGEEEGEGEEEAGRSERGVVATSLVLPTAPGTSCVILDLAVTESLRDPRRGLGAVVLADVCCCVFLDS